MGLSPNAEKRAKQIANLKRPPKGSHPIRRGCPKSPTKKLIEELVQNGYPLPKKSEIRDGLLFCAYSSEEQLKKVVNDKTMPMALRIYAKRVLGEKGFDTIEKVLDRTIGKMLDITSNGETLKDHSLIVEVIDKASQVERNNDTTETAESE